MKRLNKILIGAAASVAVFTPAAFALTSCGMPWLGHKGDETTVEVDKNDPKKEAVVYYWLVGSIKDVKTEASIEIKDGLTEDQIWFDSKAEVDGKNIYFRFNRKSSWTSQTFNDINVCLRIKCTKGDWTNNFHHDYTVKAK